MKKRPLSRVWGSALALGLAVAIGCGGGGGGGSKTSSTPAATTSGGLATISANGKVTAFVPTTGGLGVLTVSSSSLGKIVMSPSSLAPKTIISLPFAVNSCTADGTALKVICVSYSTSQIAVIDVSGFISSGATPTVQTYDLGNTTSSSFSGGGCLNCGVLADVGNSRFILSSGDGYRVVSYTGTVQTSYLSNLSATPPMNLSTENFGYDPTAKRIISPEYETANNYLWVIDLNKAKVYRWDKAMTGADLPELVSAGVSTLTADAAAVDPSTGIVSIGHEWRPLLLNINMNSASFNDAAGTFSAPYSVNPLDNVYSPTTWLTTGMVLESSNHLLFLEEEFGDGMGIVAFPSSAGSGATVSVSNYNSGQIPSPAAAGCPSTTTWSNAGDPHGLAIFASVVSGNPVGLLVDDTKDCLALVDLKAFLAAPKTAGTNQVASTAGFVSFIPIQ